MYDDLSRELQLALRNLGRCLEAMGEYRNQCVLTGGLAAVVYRFLLPVSPGGQQLLTTFDVDVGVPHPLAIREGLELDKMMTDAGFEVYSVGEGKTLAHFYKHREQDPGRFSAYHVEFLTPLPEAVQGGDQDGRSLELQPNLVVQALPYLDLLFEDPIICSAASVPALDIPSDVTFRIANPAMYIAQKTLAWPSRAEHKQEKDLAYIYYVILIHRSKWQDIAEQLSRVAHGSPRYGHWISQAVNALEELYCSPNAAGPVGVVSEYRDVVYGEIREETVIRVLRQFIDAIK